MTPDIQHYATMPFTPTVDWDGILLERMGLPDDIKSWTPQQRTDWEKNYGLIAAEWHEANNPATMALLDWCRDTGSFVKEVHYQAPETWLEGDILLTITFDDPAAKMLAKLTWNGIG